MNASGRTRGLSRALGASLLTVLVSAGAAEARPGDLDPTFGDSGFVITDFGDDELFFDIAVQTDDKIVAAGFSGNDFAVARYNADGSLDPSFDGDGMALTGFGADEGATSVAVQPDGKAVAAGFTQAGPNPPNFALARYNADGSLDASFEGDGLVFTDFGDDDYATDVHVQADGKIVATGPTVAGAGMANFAFARYNADGSPDNSFDADGRRTIEFGALDVASASAIGPDGSVVATGFSTTNGEFDIAMARLTPGGTPDPGFGVSGRFTTDIQDMDAGEQVAVLSDNRIVVGGGASTGGNSDTAVLRYEADGDLDPTFGGTGIVIRDSGGPSDASGGMAIQPDGKILIQAGAAFDLARFNPDGSTDLGFGTNGIAPIALGGDTGGHALALQSDGSVIEGGFTDLGLNPDNFAVARIAGGEPDPGPEPPDPGPRPTCQGKVANVVAIAGVLTTGTPNDDVIVGTTGRDRIDAGGGSDVICALSGRSRIKGGPGADSIIGGNRRDVVRGGGGADVLRGKRANDRLFGNGGADLLVGGKGRADRCVGGAGFDRDRSC